MNYYHNHDEINGNIINGQLNEIKGYDNIIEGKRNRIIGLNN